MRARGDDGYVTVLTIGCVVVALALIAVVGAAAQVHLERKRLLALADVLALDASDAVADDVYYDPRAPQRIALTDASVRASVDEYLAAHPEAVGDWSDFGAAADVPEADVARVELVAVCLPAGPAGWLVAPWSDGVTISAVATARAR
ncbi:hypothetical protein CCO02nite_21110 [Cellulomonas composti]|uniref:Uncharacterized protein n=1 Tax=Cellulomonas composti TaxID=266130 RepID=A0A511JCM1_9CELL|nr:hypothetical protein CCO02nite_21110 [Cellulomonas composti]